MFVSKLLFEGIVFGVVEKNIFKWGITISNCFGPGKIRVCMDGGL